MRVTRYSVALLGCLCAVLALAGEPPSRPPIDSPELAHLGDASVGVRTITVVDKDRPDVLAFDEQTHSAPPHDRVLKVDIWYPAQALRGATPVTYSGILPSETAGSQGTFSVPGIAVRDAPPVAGRHPLVILSHGRRNDVAALVWLGENLASKGYVVAAIHHQDSPLSDRLAHAGWLLNRPLDIAFVARSLQSSLAAEGLVDPTRTALFGYSAGGYGVLTAAGAVLDPGSRIVTAGVPGGLLLPYARGGALQQATQVPGLKAVIAMSPAGGGALAAWGREGLAGIHAPLLIISGDVDWTVDYATGARAMLDAATGTRRYLLTFKGAGHNIGLIPAPESMRSNLWFWSYFEDPVWRKDRIIGVSLHMITAFLDRYVRDDESRASYLDGLVPDSNSGRWPAELRKNFDAFSPGTGGITVWKGFQNEFYTNLELLQRAPQGGSAPPPTDLMLVPKRP